MTKDQVSKLLPDVLLEVRNWVAHVAKVADPRAGAMSDRP